MSSTNQAVAIALGLFLLSGAVAGTSASMNGETTNAASTMTTDSLNPPSALTATGSNTNVVLSWSAGSMGSGGTTFGHRVREKANATQTGTLDGLTAPTCDTSTVFTTTSTNAANNVTTYTDSGVATATNQGSYMCYEVDTQYPQGASPTWFSQTLNADQVAGVQIGYVINSIQIFPKAGGTSALEQGDRFFIRYSQPFDTTKVSSTWTICEKPSQELNIGRVGTTVCGNAETNNIATIASWTGTATTATWNVTWTAKKACDKTTGVCTACGTTDCMVLEALLGTAANGGPTSAAVVGGTITPAATVTSKTGAVAPCSTTNTLNVRVCRPVLSGSA